MADFRNMVLGPGGNQHILDRHFADGHLELLAALERASDMHYRNGREAHNGDKVVSLAGYGSGPVTINAIGILFDAKPDGGTHCNGAIASTIGGPVVGACLCDCLHLDDVADLIVKAGWDKRSAGK